VVVVDGTSIHYTNLTDISNGSPITVEGITMHVLGAGTRFLVREREIVFNNKRTNLKSK
jgi:cyanophycinase-like exopeptidase